MEEKKINVPAEINDDELDLVAGGAYTYDEWKAMSEEERRAAQLRSIEARKAGKPCELD